MAKSKSKKKTTTHEKSTETLRPPKTTATGIQTQPLPVRATVSGLGPTLRKFGPRIALALSLLANVYQLLGGPPWPVDPEIHSRDSLDVSSKVLLPFQIKNRSSMSPMEDVSMDCVVDLVYFADANKKTGLFSGGRFHVGSISIPRDHPINYRCDASDNIRILPDGSAQVGFPGGQLMQTRAGVYTPPMSVLKMCLHIVGTYKVYGFTESFTSSVFQWPAEPNHSEWLDGPMAFDFDQTKWIPEASTLVGAWGLRRLTEIKPDGTAVPLPEALRCTALGPVQAEFDRDTGSTR